MYRNVDGNSEGKAHKNWQTKAILDNVLSGTGTGAGVEFACIIFLGIKKEVGSFGPP